MMFSESELANLYKKHTFETGLVRFSEYLLHKEYTMRDCRFDFFCNIGDRYFAIIELKIHATVDAILQIIRYEKLIRGNYPTKFKIIRLVIVAQFFDDNVIILADELKIELIQISPINRNSANLNEMDIVPPRHFLKTRMRNV